MTKIEGHHEDGCLMCAVRALTEGRAKEWMPEEEFNAGIIPEITGVILRQGTQPSHFANEPVPFIELWTGGTVRFRLTGHSGMLASLMKGAELQVGDTVTVRYLGKKELKQTESQAKRGHAPNQYKVWELDVSRGHR